MNKFIDFNLIPSNLTNVKIDIGLSYNAPQSNIWLSKENNIVVFGFEPNPDSIISLQNGNIKKRNNSHGEPLNNKYIKENRFFLIPCALSSKEGTLDFYVNKNDCGTSSLYKPKNEILGDLEKIIKVPVFKLKDFFDIFPWDRFSYIDYIKIDAQGSDLDILKGAENYLTERVVYITAEPDGHQYYGADSCNKNNIKEYMESINFIEINHPNTIDPTYINKNFYHVRDIFICQR